MFLQLRFTSKIYYFLLLLCIHYVKKLLNPTTSEGANGVLGGGPQPNAPSDLNKPPRNRPGGYYTARELVLILLFYIRDRRLLIRDNLLFLHFIVYTYYFNV